MSGDSERDRAYSVHYKNRGSAQLVHYQRMHVVSKVSERFPTYIWEILGHLGNYVHSLVVYNLRTPSFLVVVGG